MEDGARSTHLTAISKNFERAVRTNGGVPAMVCCAAPTTRGNGVTHSPLKCLARAVRRHDVHLSSHHVQPQPRNAQACVVCQCTTTIRRTIHASPTVARQ